MKFLTKNIQQNVLLYILLFVVFNCGKTEVKDEILKTEVVKDSTKYVIVSHDIQIKNYFQFIDSIVENSNNLENLNLTEHLLIRSNPWIIDSLVNTDYYIMKEKDSFIYNQKEMIVLKKGSKIKIPDSLAIDSLLQSFNSTKIEVNIPEFKLRIFEDSICLYEFSVRVGRNERKYLKMGDRITDLRTIRGNGTIVSHVRNPDYYNPATGRKYYATVRDDFKTTKLPQIPYIETEINGVRNGQMIHPTTNPITLGKAYSNGCIGVSEGDTWIIYYYAEIGTRININYDLNITNNDGEPIICNNIYNYKLNE